MLVVSRGKNERVVMVLPDGRTVEIVYCGLSFDGKVRLGFIADRDIVIDRKEIHERKLARTASGEGEGFPG